MTTLRNRQIIVGVTGGIAAYKTAELVRLLRRQQAQVRVVMTAAAQEFITPLTMQALSGQPVHTALLDTTAEAGMGHIELARWGELLLVAPATADFLARLAHGLADDLLTTVCLASNAQLLVAPAMNQAMWRNAATVANIEVLRQRGVQILGPDEGLQACGDTGPGRMLEPAALLAALDGGTASPLLAGKRVVVTAGPTREAIDPVRYITNHSSGKMGYALAQAAAEAGAQVTLVSGPVSLPVPPGVERIDVVSAAQMQQVCDTVCLYADVFIAAAAVADYRPKHVPEQKIKKGDSDGLNLALVQNDDILAGIARQHPGLLTVGFAAETHNLLEYARAKRLRKGADLIIANDVSVAGIGFDSDDNAATLISNLDEVVFPRQPKRQLARALVQAIAGHLQA